MNKIQLKELDTHAAFKIDFLYVGKTRVGSSRSLIIIIFLAMQIHLGKDTDTFSKYLNF